MARQLILGTAGHIDHGKTALVRALTGVDTDRLPQEKQRGITIDIGFARLDVGGHTLGIVDVPGHERFIKNMLAGASGIDLALLVVAADDSVMPQTREHLAILELLGIEHGVIALTKCDASDEAWLDLVEQDVRSLVSGGFLAAAPIVRTSAKSGAGIDELKENLGAVAARVRDRTIDEPFRMCVDRSFVAPGLGTVVTGTVRSGALEAGDEVEWLPRKSPVRVRSIESHGEGLQRVERGRRAALNLPGVHHTDIVRGDELATPGVFEASARLAARLKALEDAPWALKHRSRVRLHIGTGETMASVRLLDRDRLAPGETAIVELACASPVVAMAGQAFVVRAESPLVTVGGGAVLQARSAVRRRDPETWRRLDTLDSDDHASRAACAIRAAGGVLSTTDLWQLCALWGGEAEDVVEALERSDEIVVLSSDHLVHRAALDDMGDVVTRTMSRLHDDNPTEPRLARGRLEQEVAYADPRLLAAAIKSLIASGKLLEKNGDVWLPGRGPSFTPAQRRVYDAWIESAREGEFSPPGPSDVAKVCNVSVDEARRMAKAGAKLGELIRITEDIYLHADTQRELVERVSEAIRSSGGLTVSDIKTLLGTSRKYAVPLCEHLDRLGVTAREGDLRVLAPEAVR